MDSVRRYLQLRAPFLSMKQSIAGDKVLVQLCAEFALPPISEFLAETVSATLILLTEQLLDRSDAEARGFALEEGKLPGVSVHLRGPEPAYYRRFAAQLPVRFEFGQPEEMLIFPRKLLDVRMRLADAEASRMARDQCEFELQKALKEQEEQSKIAQEQADVSRKEAADFVYRTSFWGTRGHGMGAPQSFLDRFPDAEDEYKHAGYLSHAALMGPVRRQLRHIIDDYGVRSMLDVPCGDQVMSSLSHSSGSPCLCHGPSQAVRAAQKGKSMH